MRVSREGWIEAIRRMQETQGLWEFDLNTQDAILTYLVAQYGAPRNREPAANRCRPILTTFSKSEPHIEASITRQLLTGGPRPHVRTAPDRALRWRARIYAAITVADRAFLP